MERTQVLEQSLSKLQKLTAQEPRSLLKKGKEEIITTEQDTTQVVWARGTGYGNNYSPQWDIQDYLATQKEKDSRIAETFKCIEDELKKLYEFSLLEQSCLVPVLESYLRNDSMLDMEQHYDLYRPLLSLIKSIASHSDLVPLFDRLRDQQVSLMEHLAVLKNLASAFIKKAERAEGLSCVLAKDIIATYSEVAQALEINSARSKGKDQCETEDGARELTDNPKKTVSLPTFEQSYVTAMKPLQFTTFPMKNADGTYDHSWSTRIASSPACSSEKVIRMVQEQSSLMKTLPLTLSSSIFLLIDEEHADTMKALITGPVGTPYESGCFQFDIYLTQFYPSEPPAIKLMTTGNGTVRFNPNLYACGKVCLSLLGTWRGSSGELWNPQTSTLLQVLISIQSLIFVPEPYFNEPGYEMHNNREASRSYNDNIRAKTVKFAMLQQLQSPSKGFEEVIKNHFYLKQKEICNTIEQWIAESPTNMELAQSYKLLREEFAKL